MTMLATILSVQRENLMVLDLSTRQKVRVNTRDAFRFRQGDIVHIRYSGAMTMSIPPTDLRHRHRKNPFPLLLRLPATLGWLFHGIAGIFQRHPGLSCARYSAPQAAACPPAAYACSSLPKGAQTGWGSYELSFLHISSYPIRSITTHTSAKMLSLPQFL